MARFFEADRIMKKNEKLKETNELRMQKLDKISEEPEDKPMMEHARSKSDADMDSDEPGGWGFRESAETRTGQSPISASGRLIK